MKKQAIWNDQIIAESDDLVEVEGNYYFPKSSLNDSYFKSSTYQTICPWKGTANYYTLEVNGEVNKNAAWYYPQPKEKAKHIEGRVAFWNGVKVVDA